MRMVKMIMMLFILMMLLILTIMMMKWWRRWMMMIIISVKNLKRGIKIVNKFHQFIFKVLVQTDG